MTPQGGLRAPGRVQGVGMRPGPSRSRATYTWVSARPLLLPPSPFPPLLLFWGALGGLSGWLSDNSARAPSFFSPSCTTRGALLWECKRVQAGLPALPVKVRVRVAALGLFPSGRELGSVEWSQPCGSGWSVTYGLTVQRSKVLNDHGRPLLQDQYSLPVTFSGKPEDWSVLASARAAYTGPEGGLVGCAMLAGAGRVVPRCVCPPTC